MQFTPPYVTLSTRQEFNSYSNLKTETVFSVTNASRFRAGHGIYQTELLAGREPVTQGTIDRSHPQEGRAPFLRSCRHHQERDGNSVMKKTKKRKKNNEVKATESKTNTNQGEIAYHNKDITSKLLAECFKGKTFRVYGLDVPEVTAVLPTNIPAVRANELRLDNLFELADGTVALVDYESEYKKADKVKYLNYLAGIASRYQNDKKDCPTIRMIVIYTGDIERKQVSAKYDIGAVRMTLEPAFLSELDSVGILRHLKEKVRKNELLNDEELMKIIILPLSYRKKDEKEKRIREAVNLAAQIEDESQQIFALSGILTFTDKLIDMNTANNIRRIIGMTKIGWIIEQEKQEALAKAEEEKQKELAKAAEEKQKELAKAAEEKQKELAKAAEEKRQALAKAEEEKQLAVAEEKQQTARETVIKMIRKNYATEEIAFIVSSFSRDAIEAVRRELAETKEINSMNA